MGTRDYGSFLMTKVIHSFILVSDREWKRSYYDSKVLNVISIYIVRIMANCKQKQSVKQHEASYSKLNHN
jgi:hypothetical protein